MTETLEPISHFFYSHRLKLQFWDWGTEGKPTMILVHGGLDHARNWDWVARALRDDFHVYAIDLSALADVINDYPIYLIGHSLGGIIALNYAGVYPDRVKKVVAIEGLGPPPSHRV